MNKYTSANIMFIMIKPCCNGVCFAEFCECYSKFISKAQCFWGKFTNEVSIVQLLSVELSLASGTQKVLNDHFLDEWKNKRKREAAKPNTVAYDFKKKKRKIFISQPQYQYLLILRELRTMKRLLTLVRGKCWGSTQRRSTARDCCVPAGFHIRSWPW